MPKMMETYSTKPTSTQDSHPESSILEFPKSTSPNFKNKILALKKSLNSGLIRKNEAINIALLAMLSGKSVFFYGPPGTGKSLIARRISCAFSEHRFFDYLMHKFSTPEEVFGPFMLSELRRDKLIRNIKGFLPDANFAFLDEIWKSSSAILNTLLTLINERRFQNGDETIKVPLIGLIAASNEFPEVDSGLEALYDRFLLRVVVDRISAKSDFQKLLLTQSAQESLDIAQDQCFSIDDLKNIKQKAQKVQLPQNILQILESIRLGINTHNSNLSAQENDEGEIEISDRRWIACMELLRVSAVCNDRDTIDETDILLLNYCLWSTLEDREALRAIIAHSILLPYAQNISIESNGQADKNLNGLQLLATKTNIFIENKELKKLLDRSIDAMLREQA